MNSFIASGRLGRDPEVRYSQGEKNTSIARFSLAVSRPYVRNGERGVDFFNCVCFGKNADFAEKYLKKGMKVIIRGRVENDNYTNKDGQKVYDWKVVIDEIDFGESRNESEAETEAETEEAPAPAPFKKKSKVKEDENGFISIPDSLDEDLPFN